MGLPPCAISNWSIYLCEKGKELESVQNELTTLRQNNIELDMELENTQLSNSIQDLTIKNSLLDSRINDVIEERKQCEDNLDQFKNYKLKEFQEVLYNTSDEMVALNNSLSLLRIDQRSATGGPRAKCGPQKHFHGPPKDGLQPFLLP
ncbi:hypothetical protein LOD99_5047 [Oopsacas minuta]|uniref:Uncharacterized protein n=1 Tax=Oopsacas minuta TaxID=111878 RepID=A0AAV7JTT2_9METZ|nr:hypothetical protein LOD99_5047 [Oopsacas minuta]